MASGSSSSAAEQRAQHSHSQSHSHSHTSHESRQRRQNGESSNGGNSSGSGTGRNRSQSGSRSGTRSGGGSGSGSNVRVAAAKVVPGTPRRDAPSSSGSGSRGSAHASGGAPPSTTSSASSAQAPALRKAASSSSTSASSRDRSGALQDPGLKDYRLGDCIGKGAFGSVYKAFNWGTGEAVAVKQIKLTDLPKSELRMIEAEIDLLKNLHHDNIVKYIGFVKSVDCLNIILEYCENGSLHSICKAYGKFPENLVGVYMTQVLQGLQYLHDQGVIHRDIKGANILTTKDGTVKLADFGVSTSSLAGPDKEAQVVGTPYWMAPEIIQLSGATSASDIWSVGCTVIELLQGRPPYHNLAAMPALFAIVNDDHPPLPEGVSPAARDFLMQCFQKDPNLRVSAKKLGRHPWIVSCRRSDAPVSKNPSEAVEEVVRWNRALESSETNLRASTGSDNSGPPLMGPLMSRHGASEIQRGARALHLAKPRPMADVFSSPELADEDNWDNDFATAISPTALQNLKPHDNFGGLLSSDRLKQFASSDSRNVSANWDNDALEGEQLMTIKPVKELAEPDFQEQTIRPINRKSDKATVTAAIAAATTASNAFARGDAISPPPMPSSASSSTVTSPQADSPKPIRRRRSKYASPNSHDSSMTRSPTKMSFGSKFELPSRPEMAYQEQPVEDYSDLLAESDLVFTSNRLNMVLNGPVEPPAPVPRSELVRSYSTPQDSPQLFHPSDLTSLPRSMQAPAGGSMRRQAASRPSVLPDRPMRRTRSSVEIERFAEDAEDEDFSDIFGPGDNLTDKEESDAGSEDGGGLMLLSKLSHSSWLGDEEDEDDPFAMMDPGWDEMDLEANIARDRHARLAERVEELVRSLKTTEGEDQLSELTEDLLSLLWENTEIKDLIISSHGLLPILEILEPCTVKSRQDMILQLLKIVNAIILDDVELQENLCFVGGIPIITKFAARQYSNEIRLEAAAFVRQMYQTSTTTLQMFVSAGGLNVLVEFLDEDYDSSRDLVLIGVNGIWNVFELQGPTPKNDFCRIFSRSKILDPLALVLHKVLDEDDEDGTGLSELIEGRIVNIFYLFSQAENYVKEVVADRQVLKTVLKDLRRMTPIHQITMLKFIKNLSMLSTTLETLHSADGIDFLIDVLSQSMKKGQNHFREISNQVLNTMFNLCRLSKERQEYAAVNGIIPLLLKIMQTERPPKEFALPILCDMAHSGSKGRRYLWQNKGLDFYVSLLADQYWQVTALDAIFIWLQEETAKVEAHLLNDGRFKTAIVACFNTAKVNAFDPNLLEPLLKVLRLSPSLAADLAQAEMYSGVAQKFTHKKAVVRLNLLRLVRNIMDNSGADMGVSSTRAGRMHLSILFEAVQKLAEKDSAVLVRNLAAELVRSHIDVPPDAAAMAMATNNASSMAAPSSSRARPGAQRRTTLYTPPGLQSSVSAPLTPTHNGAAALAHNQRHSQYNQYRALQHSQSSLSSASPALIEVAATHRRSAVALAHERDALAYRPRSRDGVSAIPRRVSGDSSSGSSVSSLSKVSGIGSASNSSLASLSSTNGSTMTSTTPTNGGGSRLPRQPMGHGRHGSRSSLGPAIISRSDSSMSNKENVGGRYSMAGGLGLGLGPSAVAAGGGERVQRLSAVGSGMGGHGGSGGTGSSSSSSDRRASIITATNANGAGGAGSRHGVGSEVKVSNRRRTRAPSADVKWS
ncbi:SEPH-like protein [Sporothrix schenckii 1099-18]|uniref:non-specific serine/threonine protein kinase n=1 Tax=Sporothrix schenckii 1099-18 TaxID=1397361 RepID=A0A0F2LZK0_SPOSC|nr:SEPH-like protein [Sporothrix schenckii 1099-18]KJR82892.1 SEPH-like protein [Sporothrix schenckii 1099-18]